MPMPHQTPWMASHRWMVRITVAGCGCPFFWKVWSLEVVGGGVVSLVYQLKSHNANVVETDCSQTAS